MSEGIWKEITDAVGFVADLATLAALIYAAVQFNAGRKASSASAFISLHESFRQAWLRYLKSGDDQHETQASFADILNLIETGCALYFDKILTGETGDLLKTYLVDIIKLIQNDDDGRARIQPMLQSHTTFKRLLRFIEENRKDIYAP